MRPALFVVSSILVLGCGASATPAAAPKTEAAACKPPKLSLAVSATDTANFGADGRGRPVQLRIFLLKNDARLQAAKFEDVWQNQQATLQDDILKMEEYTVYPGETKTYPVPSNPDAHSLAAVALFREPQGKRWFISYDLDTGKNTQPCPTERTINATLDRMQVVDGQAAGSDTSDTRGH